MKNRIRLTESQLHRVVKESVRKVLREMEDDGYNSVFTIYTTNGMRHLPDFVGNGNNLYILPPNTEMDCHNHAGRKEFLNRILNGEFEKVDPKSLGFFPSSAYGYKTYDYNADAF